MANRQNQNPGRSLVAALGLLLGFILIASATAARPGLENESRITEGLIATAIAYEIGRRCADLDARRLEGISFLLSLRAHAATLGYSEAEIADYIDDRTEQRRLEAIARDRLRAKGAIDGQWETYCAVGRAEISAGSQIGRLLQ